MNRGYMPRIHIENRSDVRDRIHMILSERNYKYNLNYTSHLIESIYVVDLILP